MDELLESVYGEEILSQRSQLQVVAPAGEGAGGGAGSEVWNRVYVIAPVNNLIWPSETEFQFSLKTNMAKNADLEGR